MIQRSLIEFSCTWKGISILILFLVFFFTDCSLSAQIEADSSAISLLNIQDTIEESTGQKEMNFRWINKLNPVPPVRNGYRSLIQNYPRPKTAAHFGLFFPGGGQLYNKDFWKVPLVWGAYGYVGYLIIDNTTRYRDFRDAVLARLNDEPDPYPQFSLPGLRRQRDFFRRNMERAYIGIVAIHALSALEAFVACHLRQFDISDDLSFHILEAPNMHYTLPGSTLSLATIRYQIR